MNTDLKILVVDDIFTNQLLINSILESMGFESKTVSNGKLAIEEMEKDIYDIVFMDIEMPVMNGVETTKFIRNNFSEPQKSIPIIALTAHNMHEFSENTRTAGFTEIVSKPYSLEKFKGLLTKYAGSEKL